MHATRPLSRLRRAMLLTLGVAACVVAFGHDDEPDGDGVLPRDVRGTPRKPTYHRHVAKILRKHCTTCHHAGDIAPFSLDNATDAADWIGAGLEQIRLGAMPPWRPTRGVGLLLDERGLSDREISTLVRWEEQGAPEGRPPRKPKTPEYASGWSLGEPDVVARYAEPFQVPGTGDDIYRCFPLATDFGRDVFLRGLDVRPGDRRVVHHVVLYMDTERESFDLDAAEAGPGYTCFGGPGLEQWDRLLEGGLDIADGLPPSPVVGGWAPGNRPSFLPKGTGIRIPAGATIVMQVHYHPLAGEPVSDHTEFGMYVTDDPDTREVLLTPIVDTEFTIPAGEANYVVETEIDPSELIREAIGLTIDIGAEVYGVLPHMHLLGSEIEVGVNLPDGTSQRLVEIRDWSFDWQDTYYFERPVAVPERSSLTLRCVFDNSADNPLNPNVPPQPVSWGERTVDEMALAFVILAPRFPDAALDLFELAEAPLPHPRGLPEVHALRPPEVRRVRVDKRGRLTVSARRLTRGGRIEIDGEALDDSMSRRRRGALRSEHDWEDLVHPGETVELRVRRADGRLSHPVSFTRP